MIINGDEGCVRNIVIPIKMRDISLQQSQLSYEGILRKISKLEKQAARRIVKRKQIASKSNSTKIRSEENVNKAMKKINKQAVIQDTEANKLELSWMQRRNPKNDENIINPTQQSRKDLFHDDENVKKSKPKLSFQEVQLTITPQKKSKKPVTDPFIIIKTQQNQICKVAQNLNHKNMLNSKSSFSKKQQSAIQELRDIKQPNLKQLSISTMILKNQVNIAQQDLQSIIELFSVNSGDYPFMHKSLPHLTMKVIRKNLKAIFYKVLGLITQQLQHRHGASFKHWTIQETKEIVRQLHRVRATNRLMSQQNIEFRRLFIALAKHCINQQNQFTIKDAQYIYNKIESFIRGYNTIDRYLNQYKKQHKNKEKVEKDEVMNQCKRQEKEEEKGKQLTHEWTEFEEKYLCWLYQKDDWVQLSNLMNLKFVQEEEFKSSLAIKQKVDELIDRVLRMLLPSEEQSLKKDEELSREKVWKLLIDEHQISNKKQSESLKAKILTFPLINNPTQNDICQLIELIDQFSKKNEIIKANIKTDMNLIDRK